jgi:Domain of unknown function (DUF4145)
MPDLYCPFCKTRANFSQVWSAGFLPNGADVFGESLLTAGDTEVALLCDNSQCQMVIGAILDGVGQIVEYWPSSYRGKDYPDVPDHIGDAANEAHLALSAGAPHAAVAMARAVVEATAKQQGVVAGKLIAKIDALAEAGKISEHMKAAAYEIRFAGNEAAHGDLVENAIDLTDARDILDLMDAILLRVYQEPALVERVRERRKARLDS